MSDTGNDYSRNTHEQSEHQATRKHVFVVNGSPPFLNMMRELLQDERYNVTTTNYMPDTFDQIHGLDPDLLIIDLVVHQQQGWILLERIRDQAIANQIPVVVVSTDRRLLARAEAAHPEGAADRYLVKPADLDVILETIHSLIGPA